MKTGWTILNNKWYYLNEDGTMATGWIYLNYKRYWAEQSGEIVINDWRNINNNWYYFNSSGEAVRGWNWINNAMYYCRNMENQGVYGWAKQNGTIANTGDIIDDSNNFDTHLIKNVEWGAVCYLAESKYGINKEITGNTSLISAKGGISSTTTGNETGIYDMAGQNAEFVSAYYSWDENNSNVNKYTNATKFDKKYVDILWQFI